MTDTAAVARTDPRGHFCSRRVALLVTLTMLGCPSEGELTRVVVEVHSDFAEELASIRVQVGDEQGTRQSDAQTFATSAPKAPQDDFVLSFAVAPRPGAESGAFIVKAVGMDKNGTEVVSASERGAFVPHKTTRLLVHLDQACGLNACDGSMSTCTTPWPSSADAGCAAVDLLDGSASGVSHGGKDAGDASNVSAAMDGPAPISESCINDGALRCAARAGGRQKCVAGVWADAEPCGTGQVCSAKGETPGACIGVAEVCKGAAGQAVCDGQVMYRCAEDGTVSSQESCGSSHHCEVGKTVAMCAQCIPGEEFTCSDKKLERCSDDGQSFTLVQECETAALCNKALGACSPEVCRPEDFFCDGDVLKTCNAADDGWDIVMMCGAGLCDRDAGECDQCVPGTKSCSGNQVVTCNASGQGHSMTACAEGTTRCVGNGQCVQCAADSDCADPGACRLRHCNLAAGACEPQTAAERSTCSGGLCNLQGQCLQCLESSDCGPPGPCKVKQCNSGTCVEIDAEVGTSCDSLQGGQVCNDNGSCVACLVDGDCNGRVSVDACHEVACVANACTTRIKAWATCGSGKVCNGSTGACEMACGNGRRESTEDCDPSAGGDNWRCNSQTCKWTGLDASTTYRKHCASNDECGRNETCKLATWFSALLGSPAICVPTCSASGTCPIPPGYAITTTTGGDATCDRNADDCHVKCTSDSECPPQVSCNLQIGSCYGPPR